jgi:hypothetical protein
VDAGCGILVSLYIYCNTCWGCPLYVVVAAGKVAPSEEARRLVADSVLQEPLTEFCRPVLPADAKLDDGYNKLSEASVLTQVHGLHDSHGDGHSADLRVGARLSLMGGGADCGSMEFVLPEAVCGRDDVVLSFPFKHGDVYFLPNCSGHKRYSLIEHRVRSGFLADGGTMFRPRAGRCLL